MTAVEPGAYVVSAKTTVVQTGESDDDESNAYVRCTLDAGGASTDSAETELGGEDDDDSVPRRATLHTHVLATLASSGTITLRCRRYGSDPPAAVARQTKIIVVKVDSVTRTAVSG